MFADDSKLHSNALTCDQTDRLQCDLDKMPEWSTKYQMQFNADKCKRQHVGHSYASVTYSIVGVEIRNVEAEKHLGLPIGSTIDSSIQCANVVSTANKVLGVIKRTYVHKSQRNIMYLYKSLVRPHLEYC